MSVKARKIDKGSVLDFGGLGIADDALLAGPSSHLMQPKLDRPILRIELMNINQESPFQTRQEVFDPKNFPEDEELLESVRANGVLEPIMVLDVSPPGNSQDYQIVFGHRRVAAARHAGLGEITAIVTQDENDQHQLEPMVKQLNENLGIEGELEIKLAGDAGYNMGKNLEYIDQQKWIDAYISMFDRSEESPNINKFHKENFEYDEDEDRWICSEGKYLEFMNEYIQERHLHLMNAN